MAITSRDIFATIIPLTLQGDGHQRAYIAYAAVRAVLEAKSPEGRPAILTEALEELRLMFHDLDGWSELSSGQADVVKTVANLLTASDGLECLKITHIALETFLRTVPFYERSEALDETLRSLRSAVVTQ